MVKGFRAWVCRVFGIAESHDVPTVSSKIDGVEERSEPVVHETVRKSVHGSGRLKLKHRRELLGDEQFEMMGAHSGTKKTQAIKSKDTARLFGSTLRTSSRQLRILDWDKTQLRRYGLPLWRTEADLAAALGITIGQLRYFSTHRHRERAPHYITYGIKKRAGGVRIIHAPKKKLKALQRELNRQLVSKLPVSDYAHGFLKDRSIKTGAQVHVGKSVLLKMDLKDFFPSVTYARVRGLLIAYGYGYVVAATLAVLMTEALRQPVEVNGTIYHVPVGPRTCVQGAPTSPGLCNALLLRLDRRLAGLAKKHGFAYTRYADDLTFSGSSKTGLAFLLRQAKWVVEQEGFEVNAAKTRVMNRGRRQEVTGVTVNSVLGLSRKKRRRIRAMLHRASIEGTDANAKSRLQGLLAWVHMLNPEQAAVLRGKGLGVRG